MSWRDIHRFVRSALWEPSRPQILTWLQQLPRCTDGKLLGTCLAIDLATGALSAEDLHPIFSNIDLTGSNARISFAEALDSQSKRQNFLCASRLERTYIDDTARYVRILSLRDFITYYAGPTYGYNSHDPVDQQDVRRQFFSSKKGVALGDINHWWSGKLPIVWVTNSTSVFASQLGKSASSSANNLNDTYGLGFAINEELVMIQYPQNYDRSTPCFQPTTLDVNWSSDGGYYVSYKKLDAWGRTLPCSGKGEQRPERVHSHQKGLTDEFLSLPIGEITELDSNRKRIQLTAYKRFRDAQVK